jgi:hypothetical protein
MLSIANLAAGKRQGTSLGRVIAITSQQRGIIAAVPSSAPHKPRIKTIRGTVDDWSGLLHYEAIVGAELVPARLSSWKGLFSQDEVISTAGKKRTLARPCCLSNLRTRSGRLLPDMALPLRKHLSAWLF